MSSSTKNTATKEEAKPTAVPKIRFPEFRGTEGWKAMPLSELVSALDAGVSVNSGDRPAAGSEIGILKTSAITNGIFEPQENKVVFDEVERRRVKERVQKDTIIISRMNTPALVGASAYVETGLENIYLPDRLWAAKSKPGTSMRFVAAILGSGKGRAALSKLAKGSSGSMKNITKPDVLAFLIEAPSPREQKKIAECLSSVDELIAAQARKVDSLKTHKKGLMQQLFPREDEIQPRLRFPEFKGEWNDATLEELCFSISSGKDMRESDGAFDLYGSTGVIGKTATASYETPHILVARVGANAGHLTKASGQFGVTDNTLVISLKPVATIDYILHYLGNIHINKLIFGSGQPLITGSILKALRVLVPSASEQSKISRCLSAIDDLIDAESDKMGFLRAYKIGLMQQLFPSAEEL